MKLESLLNVKYPIIQAGMANFSGHALAAAISNAGGLGTIGAGYMNRETLEQEIIETNNLTDNTFAVNLFVPSNPTKDKNKITRARALLEPYRTALGLKDLKIADTNETTDFNEKIDTVIKYNVPIVSFTFGIPTKVTIEKLKSHNITLIGTATNLEEALLNELHGMDAVVLQGSEAGGHRGYFTNDKDTMIGLMAFIPEVVDELNIPVIAAGGIVDSRGIKAAHALGAQGVQIGSLFLNTNESLAPTTHKQLITKEIDNTVLTKVFSGKTARGINNTFIEEMKSYEDELPDYPLQNQLTSPIRKEAGLQKETSFLSLWKGQGRIKLQDDLSAESVFKSLIN